MANHNQQPQPPTDVAIIDYFLTNPMGEVSLLHRFLGAALAARGRVTPAAPAERQAQPAGPLIHSQYAPGEVATMVGGIQRPHWADNAPTVEVPVPPAVQPPIIRRRRRRTPAVAGAPAGPGTATVAVEMAATGEVGQVEGLDADPGLPPEEMGG